MEHLVLAPTVAVVVRVTEDSASRGLIIPLIIETIRLDPSRSDQIDEASNLSRPDPTGSDQIDVEHQATDLALQSAWEPGVLAAGYRLSRSRSLLVSRSSIYGSSSGGWPAAIARPRSSSAFSSAPSRIAVLDSHSQTRKMITLARLP
jgi:hypothetical protein